jgi:hypothetical protein
MPAVCKGVKSINQMSYNTACDEVKELLKQRASNYDGTSAEDLYDLLPEKIKGNSKAIILFLKGCPERGIEPAEVMHIISEKNGGSDDSSNLMWGPRDINRRIGGDNMSPEDIAEVNQANEETIDMILSDMDLISVLNCTDAEGPDSSVPYVPDVDIHASPLDNEPNVSYDNEFLDVDFDEAQEEIASLVGGSLESFCGWVPVIGFAVLSANTIRIHRKFIELEKKPKDLRTNKEKIMFDVLGRKLAFNMTLLVGGRLERTIVKSIQLNDLAHTVNRKLRKNT